MAITKMDEMFGDSEEPVSTKIAVTKFNTIRLPVSSENKNRMDEMHIALFASRDTRMKSKNKFLISEILVMSQPL